MCSSDLTYPSYPNSLVTYYHKPAEEQKRAEGAYIYESDYNPQYEFGSGLSYTTFDYSNLKISSNTISGNKAIEIFVDIKNTGNREGKEVVMLFSRDMYASVTPDAKRLRRFEKIPLKAGERKTVKFEISAEDLAFVDPDGKWTTEPGDFEIKIGTLTTTLKYE